MKTRPTPIQTLAAAACLALFAGCAERDAYSLADTDSDGRISQPEFERFMLEAIFTEADADRNSLVTFEEWKTANPAAELGRFSEIDADRSGAVSPAEAKAYSAAQGTMVELFAQIDADDNSTLSRAEVEAFYTKATESEGSTPIGKLSNAAQ